MSTHSSLKPALLTASGLLSLVLSLGSVTAEPRPVDHAQRPHAPRGDWSSHTERQRTENGHTGADHVDWQQRQRPPHAMPRW